MVSACSKTLDIILLVDTTQYSTKRNATNWELTEIGLTSIVKTIDTAFPIRTNGTNIGLITFDNTAHTVLSLTDGTSLSNVMEAIHSIATSDSGTSNLKEGLNRVLDTFSTISRNQTTGGIDTFMVVIVFINSEIISEGPTISVAYQMKDENIITLVIALSPQVQYDTICQIAITPDEAVFVPYPSLPLLWHDVDDLKSKVCPYPVYGDYISFHILLLFNVICDFSANYC